MGVNSLIIVFAIGLFNLGNIGIAASPSPTPTPTSSPTPKMNCTDDTAYCDATIFRSNYYTYQFVPSRDVDLENTETFSLVHHIWGYTLENKSVTEKETLKQASGTYIDSDRTTSKTKWTNAGELGKKVTTRISSVTGYPTTNTTQTIDNLPAFQWPFSNYGLFRGNSGLVEATDSDSGIKTKTSVTHNDTLKYVGGQSHFSAKGSCLKIEVESTIYIGYIDPRLEVKNPNVKSSYTHYGPKRIEFQCLKAGSEIEINPGYTPKTGEFVTWGATLEFITDSSYCCR